MTFEPLRRYLWAADLGAIVVCSTLLARAAAGGVESRLTIPLPAPAETRPAAPLDRVGAVVLARDIFCSACPVAGQEGSLPMAAGGPQRTSLPLVLVAVIHSPPPGQRWSAALVRDTTDNALQALRVGGTVLSATITEIHETRVTLESGGKAEYLDLLDPPPPRATAMAPPRTGAAADPLGQEMERGIRKTGEHSYEIQRATLESVLGNVNLLVRSARVLPEVRDGKAAGLRLVAVQAQGPLARIGMQAGDLLSSINGLELTSMEKSLEVYSKVRSASHLSLGLERNGKKLTIDYAVR
jgi:general secretion pathway protein C